MFYPVFISQTSNYMAITNLLMDIYVFIILKTSKGVIADNPLLCLIFAPYESKSVVRGTIRWPT